MPLPKAEAATMACISLRIKAYTLQCIGLGIQQIMYFYSSNKPSWIADIQARIIKVNTNPPKHRIILMAIGIHLNVSTQQNLNS